MWQAVVERFERHAPASVTARLALEQAVPAQWIDEVFDEHRQRQYPRELLFSTVVELMTLVTLGLRPSLHAAARQMDQQLPVSLALKGVLLRLLWGRTFAGNSAALLAGPRYDSPADHRSTSARLSRPTLKFFVQVGSVAKTYLPRFVDGSSIG